MLSLPALIERQTCSVNYQERRRINNLIATAVKPLAATKPREWTSKTIETVFMAIWTAVFGTEQSTDLLTETLLFLEIDTATARTRTRAVKGKVKCVRVGVNLNEFSQLEPADVCAVYGQAAKGPLGFLVEHLKHEFIHMLISTIFSKPLDNTLHFQDAHGNVFAYWAKQLFAHSLPERRAQRGKIMKFVLKP